MKILLVSGLSSTGGRFGTSLNTVIAASVVVLMAAACAGSWYGYRFAMDTVAAEQAEQAAQVAAARLEEQREELQDTRLQAEEHLDALALKLGELQSHVMRIDALGERLTRLGNLEADEFRFDQPPPRGGREMPANAESVGVEEILDEISRLEAYLVDREHKLGVLESILMHQQLHDEVYPSEDAIRNGWISSSYGYRKDPFNGKRVFHHGIDFAGVEGDDVFAAAAGIVTMSGEKSGYGKLVEIVHGNGYTTRYGHNKKLLVKVGDIVQKGDVIAQVGSTGRSTGPHVHFEVAIDGKSVNPREYLRSIN